MALEPLTGTRVVDLFAGSGALGIEALSRGATHVDFVELEAGARRSLGENLAALGLLERSRVWALVLPREVERLARPLAQADLVLADPPYGGRAAREMLDALGREGVLKPEARVVIEHHAKDEIPERSGRLARVRGRRYGETMVSTYQVAESAAEERGR